LVGAAPRGRALIIDDVITAGTAIRESVALLAAAGAEVAGVVLGLDRRERGRGAESATQELAREIGAPVISIVDIGHIIEYLETGAEQAEAETVRRYRQEYGV
jgi:orotate phosphoribosyltransferase